MNVTFVINSTVITCTQRVIPWYCTAHNKMAAVKIDMRSNIIKMNLTEEKRHILEFLLAVVSCRSETQCVGNVHNVSSTRVAEFDFLAENLDIVDV